MGRTKRTQAEKDAGQLALCQLDDEGFKVIQLSEYHYRINDYWDFWPTSQKWFNISSYKKGQGVDALIAAIKYYVC